jgi:DNA-binding transcriptional MerR regulator
MDLLTMAEIARRLDLPESTVRYYRDRFPEFVPAVGEGRARRYRPEALEALRTIADAMREGTPAEEVGAALARQYPITAIDRNQPQQQDRNQPQPTAAVRQLIAEVVADAEKALLEVAAETATLRNEQQELIAVTATLRNELRSQPQQTAAAIEAADRRHEEALRRLCEQQEAQMDELRQWLETRLPPTEAKRLGLVARMKAMLGRDRHG